MLKDVEEMACSMLGSARARGPGTGTDILYLVERTLHDSNGLVEIDATAGPARWSSCVLAARLCAAVFPGGPMFDGVSLRILLTGLRVSPEQ
jgi:hypothetical protein